MGVDLNTVAYPIYRIMNEEIQNYHNNPILKSPFPTINVPVPSVNLSLWGLNRKAYNGGFKKYTPLPDPPPEARLQLNVSSESTGHVFINYVIWDSQATCFKRRDIHYADTIFEPGQFREQGGFEQRIPHGEALAAGIVIDQKNGHILLNNGLRIDGPTGHLFDAEGRILK